MAESLTSFTAAAKLTHWLDALAGGGHGARFPVEVADVALWVGQELKWADPIHEVKSANIRNFEGGLFYLEDRKGWVMLYNEVIRSAGRRRFTQAHELGHYLIHRARQSTFECTQSDMLHWGPDLKLMESEADDFAANLLMPLNHFRLDTEGQSINFEILSVCSDKYGVSLTAAALRWIKSTAQSAVLVLSRDGFMDWSFSSDRAFKKGAFFRTKHEPLEIPASSHLAASPSILHKRGIDIAANVWFPHAHPEARLREMNVLCENYGYTLTLLSMSAGDEVWAPRTER